MLHLAERYSPQINEKKIEIKNEIRKFLSKIIIKKHTGIHDRNHIISNIFLRP